MEPPPPDDPMKVRAISDLGDAVDRQTEMLEDLNENLSHYATVTQMETELDSRVQSLERRMGGKVRRTRIAATIGVLIVSLIMGTVAYVKAERAAAMARCEATQATYAAMRGAIDHLTAPLPINPQAPAAVQAAARARNAQSAAFRVDFDTRVAPAVRC